MALRWRHVPSTTLEHDWVLSCGGWVVGRLHEQLRAAGGSRTVLGWSLTGPYEPPGAGVVTRGDAATVADAKAQIVDTMRQWSIWAGVRQPDGGGPVDPQWVHSDDGAL